MIDFIEEAADVRLHNAIDPFAAVQIVLQVLDQLLRPAPGPVAHIAFQEVLFVDRLQDASRRTLHQLVLQRRDSQRPLLTRAFGDIPAPYQLCSIALLFKPFHQRIDIRLQVRLILPPG